MWPPRANPKVTAGFTWPPEMLAPTETATKRAKATESLVIMTINNHSNLTPTKMFHSKTWILSLGFLLPISYVALMFHD